MQLGHIKCYFAQSNQYSSLDRDSVLKMACEYTLLGWKTAIEYNAKTGYYTLYWGA